MTNEIRDSETDPFVLYCYSPHDLFEFSFVEESMIIMQCIMISMLHSKPVQMQFVLYYLALLNLLLTPSLPTGGRIPCSLHQISPWQSIHEADLHQIPYRPESLLPDIFSEDQTDILSFWIKHCISPVLILHCLVLNYILAFLKFFFIQRLAFGARRNRYLIED